jgi:tetratricopeptide (TPR) repeat protein
MFSRTSRLLASTLLISSVLTSSPGFSATEPASGTTAPASSAPAAAAPNTTSAVTTSAPAKTDAATTQEKKTADIGLDAKTLQLINRGDWKGAIARLQTLPQPSAVAQGWLAFAYMFQGQCDDLTKLNDTVQADAKKDPLYSQLVLAFNLTCRNKLEEAVKILSDLPKGAGNDVLSNFGRAAVSGKMGKSAMAMHFVQKAVNDAPNFGWGFRTLGYMQERWFKDMSSAQENLEKALAISPTFGEARDMLVDAKLSSNDFDGAIDVAQAGIKADPREANNYYRLAQIYIQQWRLKEALLQLDRAIAIAPDDARFRRSRSSILRHRGQLNDAIAEQQKAVDLSKDKAFELVQLAALNIQAGNTNRAADNLRDALKLDPDNQAAHQKLTQILTQEKRYADLAEEYQRAIARKPKAADLHLGLARALKFAGKIDEAGIHFIEASNLDPNDPQPHREMGALHIEKKDLPAAAKEYTRALNLNPSSAEDLVALGYVYAQSDDFLRAEAAFMTALALQQLTPPSGPAAAAARIDVIRALAALLLEEGRYGDSASQWEAIVALTKKIGANPLDDFYLAESKMLRDRSGAAAKAVLPAFDALTEEQKRQQRGAFIEALLQIGQTEIAQTFIAQSPESVRKEDPTMLRYQAAIMRVKNDLAAAEQTAQQAVNMATERNADSNVLSDALTELAQIQFAKGDLPAADATIAKAITADARSYMALEIAGRIHLKRGDKARAIDDAKKSLEINPYWAQSYLLLGDAEAQSNNFKEALAQYKKAAELYPGLLEAHKSLLTSYRKLAMTDDIKREEEAISQMEKRD